MAEGKNFSEGLEERAEVFESVLKGMSE